LSEADWKATAESTYRAIGRFIFEFSQVEYTIRYYLAFEIDLKDDFFSAVVESYDVAVLCSVAKAVFGRSRAKENAEKIEQLINKFLKLNESRKRVAHGLWVPFKDGGTVHHVPRDKLRSVPSANQAAILEKNADEAANLRADLEQAFLAALNFDSPRR
jgi:hypothetical protein